MSIEQQPDIRLTGIHINLVDHVVTLEAQDGRTARFSFGQEATLFEAHPQGPEQLPPQTSRPSAPLDLPRLEAEAFGDPDPAPTTLDSPQRAGQSSAEAVSTYQEGREKQDTIVLSGRLRTQPKEGRPDGRGQPTAWARFAVHEEGAKDAHLYSATFHRHTAKIALALAKGAQVTAEGYPHAVGDPAQKRLDTFSVIALHHYPGKPEGQRKRGVRRE